MGDFATVTTEAEGFIIDDTSAFSPGAGFRFDE
jgi:hypothetical protein